MREGKDALALGNITGAMVFQSTIPVGIGLIFTDWELSGNAVLSIGLGLAGGLLAYESLHRARPLQAARRDRLVRPLRALHRGRRAAPERAAQAAASSAQRLEHEVVVLFRLDLGEDLGDLALGSMMKVARCTPMYFLPYIDFSPQVP